MDSTANALTPPGIQWRESEVINITRSKMALPLQELYDCCHLTFSRGLRYQLCILTSTSYSTK